MRGARAAWTLALTSRAARQWRGLASSSSKPPAPSPPPPLKIVVPTPSVNVSAASPQLTEAKFHDVADHTLEAIQVLLGPLENELDDVDIAYSQGVLNINLGDKGFWVINKQTPNRQLWWSSPLSGPRRYEYELGATAAAASGCGSGEGVAAWRATADGVDMLAQLRREMLQVSGVDLLQPLK